MKNSNRMKLCMDVTFFGADGFEKYRPNVEIILSSLERTNLIKFRLAINEAICNALRYGSGGVHDAKVRVIIRYNGNYVLAKIISTSNGFDVSHYVEGLQHIDCHDWWTALKGKNRGRGIWIMLSGSEKVIFNAAGNEVILATKLHKDSAQGNLLSKVVVLKN